MDIINSESCLDRQGVVNVDVVDKNIDRGGFVFAHVFDSEVMAVKLVCRISEYCTNTEARSHRCADEGHVCLDSIASNAIYSFCERYFSTYLFPISASHTLLSPGYFSCSNNSTLFNSCFIFYCNLCIIS